MSYDQAVAALEQAGFTAYRGERINSSVPEGLVAGTDPSGRALRKSAVGPLISTGYVPPPPKPRVTKTDKPTAKPTVTRTDKPKPTPTGKPKPTRTKGR